MEQIRLNSTYFPILQPKAVNPIPGIAPPAAFGATNIYTVQLSPSKGYINSGYATGGNTGLNRSTDIVFLDTGLLTTGIIGMPIASALTFNNVITSNTNLSEVFIARTRPSDNAYHKHNFSQRMNDTKSNLSDIVLYPNPNDGTFHVDFGRELSGTLNIYDPYSQLIYTGSFSKKPELDLNLSLSNGVYTLLINTVNGQISSNFVINH